MPTRTTTFTLYSFKPQIGNYLAATGLPSLVPQGLRPADSI